MYIELFVTDDSAKLRRIAGRLRNSIKKALLDQDINDIIAMQNNVKTNGEIAEYF